MLSAHLFTGTLARDLVRAFSEKLYVMLLITKKTLKKYSKLRKIMVKTITTRNIELVTNSE